MRQTALAVHDPRISNLNAAEHRPDLAFAAILDPSEPLAIHAETARQDVSLALLVDDHLLEMSHDGFAILDREPTSPADRRSKSLSIANSERWADPNSSVPSNTIFHRIDALHEEDASSRETLNNPLPPQLI
jgi:hypothetical protein